MKLFNDIHRWIFFKYKHVVYGKNLKVKGRIIVAVERGSLIIGDDVIINSGVKDNYNTIGNEVTTSFATVGGGRIQIGNRVGMSSSCFYAKDSVIIDDDVMIGGGCMIFDTNFHPISFQSRVIDDQSKIKTAPVRICKGAFIGARSIITKGVTIGERSVVGAGSVVTKSIPADEVWAGNPARRLYKICQEKG